ncbi:hypothetical protein DMENIID0001_108220 [Sergentomyia squamirostris]
MERKRGRKPKEKPPPTTISVDNPAEQERFFNSNLETLIRQFVARKFGKDSTVCPAGMKMLKDYFYSAYTFHSTSRRSPLLALYNLIPEFPSTSQDAELCTTHRCFECYVDLSKKNLIFKCELETFRKLAAERAEYMEGKPFPPADEFKERSLKLMERNLPKYLKYLEKKEKKVAQEQPAVRRQKNKGMPRSKTEEKLTAALKRKPGKPRKLVEEQDDDTLESNYPASRNTVTDKPKRRLNRAVPLPVQIEKNIIISDDSDHSPIVRKWKRGRRQIMVDESFDPSQSGSSKGGDLSRDINDNSDDCVIVEDEPGFLIPKRKKTTNQDVDIPPFCESPVPRDEPVIMTKDDDIPPWPGSPGQAKDSQESPKSTKQLDCVLSLINAPIDDNIILSDSEEEDDAIDDIPPWPGSPVQAKDSQESSKSTKQLDCVVSLINAPIDDGIILSDSEEEDDAIDDIPPWPGSPVQAKDSQESPKSTKQLDCVLSLINAPIDDDIVLSDDDSSDEVIPPWSESPTANTEPLSMSASDCDRIIVDSEKNPGTTDSGLVKSKEDPKATSQLECVQSLINPCNRPESDIVFSDLDSDDDNDDDEPLCRKSPHPNEPPPISSTPHVIEEPAVNKNLVPLKYKPGPLSKKRQLQTSVLEESGQNGPEPNTVDREMSLVSSGDEFSQPLMSSTPIVPPNMFVIQLSSCDIESHMTIQANLKDNVTRMPIPKKSARAEQEENNQISESETSNDDIPSVYEASTLDPQDQIMSVIQESPIVRNPTQDLFDSQPARPNLDEESLQQINSELSNVNLHETEDISSTQIFNSCWETVDRHSDIIGPVLESLMISSEALSSDQFRNSELLLKLLLAIGLENYGEDARNVLSPLEFIDMDSLSQCSDISYNSHDPLNMSHSTQ